MRDKYNAPVEMLVFCYRNHPFIKKRKKERQKRKEETTNTKYDDMERLNVLDIGEKTINGFVQQFKRRIQKNTVECRRCFV